MSKFVQTAASRTRARTLGARLVILLLADGAGKSDLLTWPGQETLARLCGISGRSVRTALRELEELGEIQTVRRRRRGSTVFRVSILADDFEILDDLDRKPASTLGGVKTGSGGPVLNELRPEADDRKTGSGLPTEEIGRGIPSLPASFSTADDGTRAEKSEASKPRPLPQQNPDAAACGVAGLPGDRAREAKAETEDKPPVDPDAPYGRSAGGRPLTATGGISFEKARK